MDGYYSDDEFASEISTQLKYGTVYKLTEQAEDLDGEKFDHIVFERIFCVDKEGNVVGRDHNSVIILQGNVDRTTRKFIPLHLQEKMRLSNIKYHFNMKNILMNNGELQFKPEFFSTEERTKQKKTHITDVLEQVRRIQLPREFPRGVGFVEPEVDLGQGVSTRSVHDYNKELARSRRPSRGEGCDSDKYNFLLYPLSADDRENISIYYRKRRLTGYVPGGQPYGEPGGEPGERRFNSKGYDRMGGTKKHKRSRNSKRKIKTIKHRKKKSRKRR